MVEVVVLCGENEVSADSIELVNELGKLSAKAQNLVNPITSWLKSKRSGDTIYLIGGGFLRVGYRDLYLSDHRGLEFFPKMLCVLDFFVSDQRKGLGTILFNSMLNDKKVPLSRICFDRPSEKLKSFLRNKYHVKDFVVHNNKFVTVSTL